MKQSICDLMRQQSVNWRHSSGGKSSLEPVPYQVTVPNGLGRFSVQINTSFDWRMPVDSSRADDWRAREIG